MCFNRHAWLQWDFGRNTRRQCDERWKDVLDHKYNTLYNIVMSRCCRFVPFCRTVFIQHRMYLHKFSTNWSKCSLELSRLHVCLCFCMAVWSIRCGCHAESARVIPLLHIGLTIFSLFKHDNEWHQQNWMAMHWLCS